MKVNKREDGVALVELDRPRKKNALSQALITELCKSICILGEDSDVRVVMLTDSKGALSPVRLFFTSQNLTNQLGVLAGADLSELVHITTTEAHRIQYLRNLNDRISSMRKQIIAAVVGFAVSSERFTPRTTTELSPPL